MNILETLIRNATQILVNKEENLRIDNIILGKTLYTMKNCDEVFTDMNFCLILLENAYGFAYFQDEIDYKLTKYVNKNIADVLKEDVPSYLKVALADALYCGLNNHTLRKPTLLFTGNLRKKLALASKG